MGRDKIIFSDLFRDGGSAIIRASLNGRVIGVRVMRPFAEQESDDFGKFEVTVDGQIEIVENLSQIEGLEALIKSAEKDILESLRQVFLNPKKKPDASIKEIRGQ